MNSSSFCTLSRRYGHASHRGSTATKPCMLSTCYKRPPLTSSHGRRGRVVEVRAQATQAVQEVTTKLVRTFNEVQNPATSNRPFSQAIEEFVTHCIVAYECGYSQRGVGESIDQLLASSEASIGLRLQGFDSRECTEAVGLVFVALMLSPRSVRRWSVTPAVPDETLSQWRGFVTTIVNAYFDKRMRWYSIERLQLETAVAGRAEDSDLVAERARMVFTTLETVSPQFPTR